MVNLLSTENSSYPRKSEIAAKLLFVALAYFACGRLGLEIPYLGSHITLIWLPTGIAVAVLLRWGYIFWPGIFLGALATNFSVDSSPLLDSTIATGNTLAPLLAVWLLRRLKFQTSFDRAYDILLLVMAAAIGMLVSASGGVISLVIFKVLPVQDAGAAWLSWWAGDFIGVLLVAPLLLNIFRAELKKLWAQRVEFLAWCLIMLAMNKWVLFGDNAADSHAQSLTFMLLPVVVWSAMRFGVMGSSLGVLLPTVIAAVATSLGLGPFYTVDDQHGLFMLWLFLATLVLVNLMVAALQAGRNRAEDALRLDSDFNKELIQSLPGIFYMLDVSGRFLMWNRQLESVLQYSSEEIARSHPLDFFEGNDCSLIEENIRKVFASGDTVVEAVLVAKNGVQTPYYFTGRRIERNGEAVLVGMGIDNSERKKADIALGILRAREAEALQELRVMFNISGEGFWKADTSGNIIEVNEAYCNIVGYIKDKIVGAHISMFEALEPSPEMVINHIRRIMELGTERFVTKHRHRNGHLIDIEIVASYIEQTDCVIAFMHDVSERKQIEEMLRIAAITFDTQEGIMITGADARILRVNQAFQDITGYSADEVIGCNPRIFQSGRHDAAFYQGMWSDLLSTGKWAGEIWDKRKNGEIYPKLMTVTAAYDDRRQITHYVAVFRDISNRKKSEQEIHQLAFYDSLTMLPNRRLLLDRLQQLLAVSARNARHGALLFLDLDHFKSVNDTQGHAMGDQLLVEVARRLQACVREGDSVARLGGDEFVVVLENLSSEADEAATQTESVAEKIRLELNKPYVLQDFECLSTVSIGISLFFNHQESSEDLLLHADVAMYQAKTAGRNAICFFDPQM
jgi:diguanylate cyclase (GGDEF)-like protein/PAS domain S-box-containing protein